MVLEVGPETYLHLTFGGSFLQEVKPSTPGLVDEGPRRGYLHGPRPSAMH